MSAFMVSKEHIDAIIAVIAEGPALSETTVQEWKSSIQYAKILPTNSENPLNDLGSLLVRENLSSIHYRYPDTVRNPENTPGPEERYWEKEYVYQRPARVPNVIEAFKINECYEYQACEHPGWKTSEAKKICDKLRAVLILALPGYNAAPWEWDEFTA
jgi:hypothetical protein